MLLGPKDMVTAMLIAPRIKTDSVEVAPTCNADGGPGYSSLLRFCYGRLMVAATFAACLSCLPSSLAPQFVQHKHLVRDARNIYLHKAKRLQFIQDYTDVLYVSDLGRYALVVTVQDFR